MDERTFWKLIEDALDRSDGRESTLGHLRATLIALAAEEIQAFSGIYHNIQARAQD